MLSERTRDNLSLFKNLTRIRDYYCRKVDSETNRIQFFKFYTPRPSLKTKGRLPGVRYTEELDPDVHTLWDVLISNFFNVKLVHS